MLKLWKQTGNPPWVQLVNGSVDAHGDHQGILAASLPHQVDYGGKPRSTHVGRACGHALADQTHNVTVQLWRQNTQRGQDIVDLFPVPTVTGRRRKNRRGVKLLLMLSAHYCMWLYKMKFLYSSKWYIGVRTGGCSPLHLWDVARLKAPTCLQKLRSLAVKQQVFIHQLHQDESDQLSHVLPTDQLLVTAWGKTKKKRGGAFINNWMNAEKWGEIN